MALPDRGVNVLAALLAEPRLRDGQLSFITHSFGGLIFEQLLRIAVDRSPADERAAAFAAKVSGVLFLERLMAVRHWRRWPIGRPR